MKWLFIFYRASSKERCVVLIFYTSNTGQKIMTLSLCYVNMMSVFPPNIKASIVILWYSPFVWFNRHHLNYFNFNFIICKWILWTYLKLNTLLFCQLSFQFVVMEKLFHLSSKLHDTCHLTFIKFVVKILFLINVTTAYSHYL